MEKSKPSEVEIIKLGKKIVRELQIEPGVNTLGRWMSHYVAELIQKAENSDSKAEQMEIKKECFEVILKLWENLDYLPSITKPLSELEPLIELLDTLKQNDFAYPYWQNFSDNLDNTTWQEWVDLVKKNSENIFELSLYSSINTDLLRKKREWMNDFKTIVNEDERKIFKHLEDLVNRSKSFISFTDDKEEIVNFDELSPQERYKEIFNRIEIELNEINSKFDKLKKTLLLEID